MFNDLIGQSLDRYRIVSRTGEHSLGPVFRAYDTSLERDVSVRVVGPDIASQPDFGESFGRAARVAARLDHPNLIQVFDFGEAHSFHYIVTEYIPGDNLRQLLAELERGGRWIPLSEAVQIVRQLALTLEYIRNQGVPQRLAQPANIQIKAMQSERLPFRPVLVDLGLSDLAGNGRESESGNGDATPEPAYYSPEQALGRLSDARSDVYSLGVLLFELATGQLPYPIENLEDAVRYHTRQPLPPPRVIRPDLPESLEQIIVRALEKNPQGRFADPAALAGELEQVYPSIAAIDTAPPAFESAASLMDPYHQSLEAPSAEEAPLPPVVPPAPQAAPGEEPQPDRLEILIDNAKLSVEPGKSASTTLVLRSIGEMDGRFRLVLEGLPAIWVSITPQVVPLKPGQTQEVKLTIRPSRSSHSRAGRYPFAVRVINLRNQQLETDIGATLTVAAFSRFSSELSKSRLVSGESGRIAVNNQGNTPETFTINFWNPDGELVFRPHQAQLRLPEGQVGAAEFSAEPRSTHWFGREKVYPFSAQVASSEGERQQHSGGIASFPLIPAWMIGLALLVVICLAGSLAVFLGRNSLQSSRATRTAVALQTQIAGTPLALTATAQFLEGANQATMQAAINTLAAATAQTATSQVETAVAAQAQTATAQVQATQTAVVQQATLVAAQTAAAQTAEAIQASQVAGNIAATQTAQVQQATQAAVYLAATQTAAALRETQVAADAAATAQAAAATAQAATATAQAAPTPSPTTQKSVAYIYLTAFSEAQDFKSLLQANGFQVDTLPEDAIPSTDFTNYQAILIGPQTGKDDIWGDPAGNQFRGVIDSGLPVIGLGEGGYAFFGRAGLQIGWDHGTSASGTSLVVVDPSNPLWVTPYQIEIPVNGQLDLYQSSSAYVAITVSSPIQDVTLIGRELNQDTHYPLIYQADRYLLWGFAKGPKDMTETGQRVFVNVLESLLR